MRRLAAATLAIVLAACAPAASAPSPTVAAASTGSAAVSTPAATTSLTPSGTRPVFLTVAFTDVRDGSRFTLSDFSGKSVLVIGMAVW